LLKPSEFRHMGGKIMRHMGRGGWLKTSEYRRMGKGSKLLKKRHMIFERSHIVSVVDEVSLKSNFFLNYTAIG